MNDIIKIIQNQQYLTFNDLDHSYTNVKGKKHKSCTTVIKDYQEPFRGEYWLTYKGLEALGYSPKSFLSSIVIDPLNGIYIKELDRELSYKEWPDIIDELKEAMKSIKQKWDFERYYGTTRGSLVHEYALHRVNNRIIYPYELVYQDPKIGDQLKKDLPILFDQVNDFAKQFMSHGFVPIKEECVVHSKDPYLSGQIDLLSYNVNADGFYIFDYKTDKEIRYENKYGSKMIGICSHLDDCEWNKYCLQVNLYKYMLEISTDVKVKGMFIIWFNKDNESFQRLKVPDLSDLINSITYEQQQKQRTITDLSISDKRSIPN